MCTCIHTYIYTYIHIHIHICMDYIYIHMHIYVHIHICICIYAYAHMYIYISTTRACASAQRCSSFLAMEAIANLSWVLSQHRAGCHFRPPSCPFVEPAALLLARCLTCSLRNTYKPTLAHDAVAAVVLHTHHLITRVGAGLIQFVYGSHSCMSTDLTLDKNLCSQPFSRVFSKTLYVYMCVHTYYTYVLYIFINICIFIYTYIYIYVFVHI